MRVVIVLVFHFAANRGSEEKSLVERQKKKKRWRAYESNGKWMRGSD